jgi:hypothetical protein
LFGRVVYTEDMEEKAGARLGALFYACVKPTNGVA